MRERQKGYPKKKVGSDPISNVIPRTCESVRLAQLPEGLPCRDRYMNRCTVRGRAYGQREFCRQFGLKAPVPPAGIGAG